jgi:hypothetical protein
VVFMTGNLTVSRSIVALLTDSGLAYGLAQRSLRRKNIERVVPLKNELEKFLTTSKTGMVTK